MKATIKKVKEKIRNENKQDKNKMKTKTKSVKKDWQNKTKIGK